MRILAIITARAGSKGVTGKNTRVLGDKPLIQYTFLSAQKSQLITDIIVSTDSLEIIKIAKSQGIEVPFIRPAELANDTAKSIDVVIHAVNKLHEHGRSYDAVVLLQPTNPFRPEGFIDRAIKQFISGGYDALVSVLPVPHEFNPHWVFEPDDNGNLKIATGEETIIARRQELPTAYYRDGSIYITKTDVLLNQLSFFGKTLSYIEADPQYHVNIDTPDDWMVAENLLKKYETNCNSNG